MEIKDLVGPKQVIERLRANDKQQIIGALARRAAAALGIEAQPVLDALLARERLGSTGVGDGIAIPHARAATIKHLYCLFARLEPPIDFAAIDDKPVDLVMLLLFPIDAGREHLAALAAVSRQLRDRDVAQQVRKAKGAAELLDALRQH